MAKQVKSTGVTLLVSLLLLLASASASQTCRTGCQGRPSVFTVNYETGHTYVYNFEGHTLATLPGQQGDGTKLHLKATAEISILDNCQGVLKLKGVQVTGPDSHKYTHLNDLEAHPVSFGFENGVVDRELCTNEADSEASVNIKRAVLSLFQVSPSEAIKSGKSNVLDVFGLCPTAISSSERGDTTTITKSRNLNKCHLREHLRQDFISVSYHVDSDLQTTPLLESTQDLRQQLKGGILNSADSHEKYLFRPFSNQEVGAKTAVESKLTLVSHSAQAAPEVSGNSPRSIIFEPPHVGNTGSSNAQTILEVLQKAQKAMPEYVGPTAAREFSNVVSILRQSNKDDLLSVYNQVKAGAALKSGTKMFLDGLFRAGTGDAVEVAVELLKSKKITGTEADLYYLQFAYTKYVTLKALTAAATLLDQPEFSKLAYLGIGALGGRYCSEHNCEGVAEFDAFLEKLSHPLDGGCKSSNWDEELKVIASLKALHNVHHLNEATANKLRACVLDNDLPTRVRVAVLDVFHSDACRVKQTSLEVLKNRQLDSELRIKAFLALVECPCNKMANALKEVLDSEPTYQVGSFIVSYLRNLRASTNPSKEHAKAVFGQIRTTKRFPLDFRKFSNNFEFSYLLGGLNLGSTIESNVIYSQRSFLPRASTLNLTTELFGHSVNFLEVELRQENLDLVAEKLFGPKGYFNVHDSQEIIKTGKEKWTELESSVKQKLNHAIRGKRSVTKEALEEVRHKSVAPHHSEPDRELLLELSTRLFGAEVGWFSFHDSVKDATHNAFDSTFNILEKIVKKAKNFDHKVRQHNTFLDTELIYPTSLGLPLKLVASGSSAIHVDLEGKIDINQIVNNFQNSHIHLKFVPSAAVEITSSFVVDAYAVEAGLKVATTLHTATGTDITVKATEGVGIDVTLGLPVKKQDVITLKSEVLSTVQERGKSEVDTAVTFASTPRREYHGCFDQLSPLTGLTFCGEMNFPWDPVASKAAFYPLNGPSKVSLTIENEDVTSYHFRASLNNKDPNKKSLELLLETPNSKTNRKLGLILERTFSPYYGLKAELSSPWKHVSAEVAFTDNDHELSLRGTLLNDAQEYTVKLGASVTGDTSHATYHPLLEYKTPQQTGSLVAQKGAKGQKLSSHPYSVDGSITVDKSPNSRKFTFNDVLFKTPHGEYKIDGSVSGETSKSVSTDLKVTYGENNVILKSDLKVLAPSTLHLSLVLQSSQYPDFGVNFIWDYKRDKHNLENTLVIVHGRDPNSNDARFTLHQQAHYQFEGQNVEFSTKNEVSYPLLSVLGKFEGKVTRTSLHLDLEASYEKHKFESELTAKTGVNKPGDYEIDFEAKVLDNSIEFETKREIIAADQSRFTTEIEVHPGGKYELVADVTHHCERNNINFQIDAVAKVHGQSDDYKLDAGLVVNQQLFDAHYKALIGSTEYVDISAKYNKASGSPSGNAKVFLKNYISGNAQFKFSGGKGTATLNVDIPKINRKIKGTGELQISDSHHVATVDIYFNADKNPNHKIHFHTDSDLKKDAINSKNTLVIVDYKTEFNINGQLIDKLEDGQLKGEFDLTLPHGLHLTGKLDRTLHVRQTNSEGDLKLELTAQKSATSEPAKVTFEFAAKNVDTKQYSFDGQSKLAYHAPGGKDVAVLIAAKNIPQREQRVVEGQIVLQGSLIGEPLRLEFNTEVHEPYVTFKGHGSHGTGTVVDFSGKSSRTLKEHDDIYTGPFSAETKIEIKLPIEQLKHIKLESDLNGEIQEKKLQFVYNEVLDLDDKTYKVHLETNNELEKGNNKLVVTLPNTEPKTYTSNWYFRANDYKTKEILKGGFSWSGNQDSKLTVDVNGKKDLSDFSVQATLQTPFEKLKHAELSLKNKYVPSPKFEMATDLALTVDDKKLTIVNKLTPGIVPGLPNIDFTATSPQGKNRVFLFLQSKGKHDVSGKAELEWSANEGGKLTASGKANYESAQNFKVELDVDSPALKLNKWHIMVANKPAKTAKTLQIVATEAGAPILNGRLEYHVEDHENSYKAGVSGTVKVKDSPQPLKAEISFNKFTAADNGEVGASAGVAFSLGPKSFDASSKYTNKESRASLSICPKAGECSVAEAHSVVKNIDLTHLEHEFGAKVDFKASGLSDGFVLQGKTVRQPLSFDHKVELKLLNAKHTTYKLHSYLNEKSVGVVATLPQRVIAAEGKLNYDKEKGESSLDLNFWLDKERHPENKAGLHLLGVINPSTDGTTFQGEAKFSHQALQKDFAVSGKAVLFHHNTILDATIDFDVFAKKNQKVTFVAKIVENDVKNGFNVTGLFSVKGKIVDITLEGGAEATTSGLGYNSILSYKDVQQKPKDVQIVFQLTLTELLIYVKSPTADLIKIERQISTLSDNKKSITGEVYVLGLQPVVVDQTITFQENGINLPESSQLIAYKKNAPNKKLHVELQHDVLTGFGVHIYVLDGGNKKDVLYIGVDLGDNNFLKTHFTWSTDEIKRLLVLANHDADAFVKQIKVVSHDLGEEVGHELHDILESLKKSEPDVKALLSSYQSQLKELKEELEHDEGFTEASENLKKFVNAVTKVIVEASKKITELADNALQVVVKVRTAVQEMVNKLLPKAKEIYTKTVDTATAVTSAVLEISSKYLLVVADFVKEHEDELKKLVQIVRDFIEDSGKIVGKTIVQIRTEVVSFVRVLVDQLKALPVYTSFKEQYNHFVSQVSQNLVPEQGWAVIKEVIDGFKDSIPNEELRELLNAIETYVQKHINKETVNDVEEWQQISNKALKALKSLLTFIRSHFPAAETSEGFSFLGLRLPFAGNALVEFPKFIALKLSPVLFFTSGDVKDLPTLQELIHTYRPTLNPLDWIPPYKAHGVLIHMHHFITLDGRHFTFKGTCGYVLLQDVVDGNFSVALDLASKSIIIADHHTSIEFAKDSSFKANGQAAEYPYVDGDFVVWKDYFTINVKHKAGLFVRCDKLHQFCTFHVSGYYFGKTRGLLGALDYEPWDDFKQPNGQVVTNVNDFGNSWKVDPSCADVSGPTHHDHEMPEPQECANIFGGSTSLRLGYFFVPSAPFREACSHIVADESTPEAKKKAACSVAAAYTIAAHKYIHISVPEECVHCSVVDGSPIEVGDSVSVKVPKNSADVIIVVEQDTHNTELFKELVSPLVTTLTNDLKAKDITNVHFTLIGYGEATHNYPALYTTGGKISFEGKTKNMKFIDHIDAFSLKLDSCENRWKYLTALIESELGLSAPSRAYQLGSKYPFKIGTSKVLVGLVANTKTSAFGISLQQLLALYSTKVLRDRGVAFHLIAPVQDLHITSKDAKVTKTVVGFDSDHVYVLSDAKKKVLEGSTELRNNLVYQNNIWIPIALDSYGVTYVAQNFLEAKSSARKQFLQVVSHRIAESLGTELHEDCTCRLVSGLYPFSECKVTNRKEREPLAQIRGTKGVKG